MLPCSSIRKPTTRCPSPKPQKTVSLPDLDKSIPILKPEIVIEERRWCPYPMIIRHYIEKPKSTGRCSSLKKWYNNLKEKRRLKCEQKKDVRSILIEKERVERERCLRELRRLHSHHQSLCCRSQSLPTFSKSPETCKSHKINYKTRATTAKADKKTKSKKMKTKKQKPPKVKCKRKSSPFGCIQFCCNLICCCTVLVIFALAIIVFVL